MKHILRNGLCILGKNKDVETVTVQITVNVGSNDETENINGISHFIEHMVFEGTPQRGDARIISNEVECLGGDFNAGNVS